MEGIACQLAPHPLSNKMSHDLQAQRVAGLVHDLIERLYPDASLRLCSEYARALFDFKDDDKQQHGDEENPELDLLKTFGAQAHNLYTMLLEKDAELAKRILRLLLALRSNAVMARHAPISIRSSTPLLLPPSTTLAVTKTSNKSAASTYRGVKDFLLALQGSEQNKAILLTRWQNQPRVLAEARFIFKAIEIGDVHRAVRQCAQTLVAHSRANGLISLRFGHAIQDELAGGDQFLVLLEQQRPVPHLAQLFAWSLAFKRRLSFLWQICESCRAQMGGQLLSTLFALRLCQGSQVKEALVTRVLHKSFAPMQNMIFQSCLEGGGRIVDDYGEFFVGEEGEVRLEMKPSFISPGLAQRIARLAQNAAIASRLHTGPKSTAETFATDACLLPNESSLEAFVHNAELKVNAQIKHSLFSPQPQHALLSHLSALKDFLLLARGDFSQQLVETIVRDASRMEWQNQVDFALQGSNASSIYAPDIISRLCVSEAGGWLGNDFCLDYVVDFPLNLIVTSLDKYFAAFHFIWKLKRTQSALDALWMRHSIYSRGNSITTSVIHKCSLVRAEMIHFVNNLHSYVMTEVVDASWDQLVVDLDEAEALDELAAAHERFLDSILLKGLIQEDEQADSIITGGPLGAKPSKSPLFSLRSKMRSRDTLGLPAQLALLLDLVLNFCAVQDKLFARLNSLATVEQVSLEFAKPVDAISSRYWEGLHLLLNSLESSDAEALRILRMRLDFNSFY